MIPVERLIRTPASETPPGNTVLGLGAERFRIFHNLFQSSLAVGATLLGAESTKFYLLEGDFKKAAMLAVTTIGLPIIASLYLTKVNKPLPKS
jgi:hypothetical protein